MNLVHGGDITGFVDEFGYEPLDYSASISPLGLPAAVRDAVVASLDHADQYPDPLCRHLTQAIAEQEDLKPSQVICGNGTADLIYRIARVLRPREALVCAPSFSEYTDALTAVDSRVVRYKLEPENGYGVGRSFLEKFDTNIKAVFLAQPNNPTGVMVPRIIFDWAVEACEEMGIFLIVDECFVDFLADPSISSAASFVAEHPCVIVLRSFTKLYAMPSLRLGYALCSDERVMSALRRNVQPWEVSGTALAAGLAALECADYVEEVRKVVAEEREFLKEELEKRQIGSLGDANFLFFARNDNGMLAPAMRQQGVLIRDCSNFMGLQRGYYRIAVRTHEENLTFLEKLDAAMELAPAAPAGAVFI